MLKIDIEKSQNGGYIVLKYEDIKAAMVFGKPRPTQYTFKDIKDLNAWIERNLN